MITGQCVTENLIKERIEEGNYTSNQTDAFRMFGTNFIAVSPIPQRFIPAMQKAPATVEVSNPTTCYILKPAGI